MNLVDKAKEYAIFAHRSTNHYYDVKRGVRYEVHLSLAVEAGEMFIHLIPEKERENVLAGIWVHDIIEDARETYNDVKKVLGELPAEYSFALQVDKGKTREERNSDNYYKGIRELKYATFIKLSDRLANVWYSKENGSSMFKKYQNEHPKFKEKLYNGEYDEFWNAIEKLLFN